MEKDINNNWKVILIGNTIIIIAINLILQEQNFSLKNYIGFQ